MASKVDLDRITFSVREVADALGVSDDLIRKWIKNGEIDAIRIGTRVLVLRQPLVDRILLAQGDVETTAAAKAEADHTAWQEARADAARRDPERYWREFATPEERAAYKAEQEREIDKAKQAGVSGEPIYA